MQVSWLWFLILSSNLFCRSGKLSTFSSISIEAATPEFKVVRTLYSHSPLLTWFTDVQLSGGYTSQLENSKWSKSFCLLNVGVKQALAVNDQEKVGFETDWGEANIAVKSNPSSWRCASWDSKFEDAIACIKLKLSRSVCCFKVENSRRKIRSSAFQQIQIKDRKRNPRLSSSSIFDEAEMKRKDSVSIGRLSCYHRKELLQLLGTIEKLCMYLKILVCRVKCFVSLWLLQYCQIWR